jgi:2-polyprenyl-3-methyl-5-hydroxy-6-metoxy-1,4-benzoquinol methylase
MAADYRMMVANLLAFHDLSGKTVITVGAGGGQLIEYGRAPARVLALDNDAAALDTLRERLQVTGLQNTFRPKGQSDASLARIAGFRGRAGIRIPMPYGLALIERTPH